MSDVQREPAGPAFEVPAIRITFTVQASPHRSIGFETVVEQGIAATVEWLHDHVAGATHELR